jgi:heme/copper-type cytochrome/quinol oxidase subunit 3
MLLFIVAEAMFFAGLISAYVISRAGAYAWPPAGQPRLPLAVTALNTLVLLASAVAMRQAARAFERAPAATSAAAARRALLWTIALGASFVLVQGFEWVRLIGYGLTMTSSSYGSFFYLLVGAHAVHVTAALLALVWGYRRLVAARLRGETFQALRVFWYFVVGLWPVLYALVYLS